MGALHRFTRHLARLRHDDAGMTLVELLVGMVVMSVVMTMFTGAIVLMSSSSNEVQALSTTSSEIQHAFRRLDKIVRYASGISTPGLASQAGGSNDWYVEVAAPGPQYTTTCTQLRVDVQSTQLQERSWVLDANQTSGTPSVWLPLASSVTNAAAPAGSPTVPFALLARPGSLAKQLTIRLSTATTAPGSAAATSSFSFAGANTSLDSLTDLCQQQGRP